MTEELFQPDLTAWEIALEQADGDPNRIEVVGPHEFVVHNQPISKGRPAMPTQHRGNDEQGTV